MPREHKYYGDHELAAVLKNVCRKLTAFRKECGISQNELSKRSKIALSTINEIENQIVKDLRLSTITCLARHLDRKVIEFLTDSDLNVSDQDLKDLEKACLLLSRIVQKLI